MFLVDCPVCKRQVEVEASTVDPMPCPHCRTIMVFSPPASGGAPPPSPAREDDAGAAAPHGLDPSGPPKPEPPVLEQSPPPAAFPEVHFRALVADDSLDIMRGMFQAVARPDGLSLYYKKMLALRIPVGSRARYLRKSRIKVKIGNRRLELVLTKTNGYPISLAHDLVDFLNEDNPALDSRGYALEWYLHILGFAPLGILLLMVWSLRYPHPGAVLDFYLVMLLLPCCLAIAHAETWPLPLRIALTVLLNALGYMAAAVLFLLAVAAWR
jgi:hypothetical protein